MAVCYNVAKSDNNIIYMEDKGNEIEREFEKKLTAVETQQKLGLGVKLILTVVILIAVAAGVYVALALGK